MKRPVTNFSNLPHNQPGEWVWESKHVGVVFFPIFTSSCAQTHISTTKQINNNALMFLIKWR